MNDSIAATARPRYLTCLLAVLLTLCWSATLGAQTLSAIAGNGGTKHSGDGGPALDAALEAPTHIAVDKNGNVYISESYFDYEGSFRVRKITPAGIITTFAGSGRAGADGTPPNGDGGPATAADIAPQALAADGAGNVYIYDNSHRRIRKVDANGVISTYAGGGTGTADGLTATNTAVGIVQAMAFDAAGNLFYSSDNKIRKISTSRIVTTIANQSGTWGFSGDGGPALAAELANPESLAVGPDGAIYLTDNSNGFIRRISPSNIITTIAGDGIFRQDPVAMNMFLRAPSTVNVDGRGNVFFQEAGGIWQLSPGGFLRLVSGIFCDSLFSDRCTMNPKPLVNPSPSWGDAGIALGSDGTIFVLDRYRRRAHKITPVADMPAPVGVFAFEPYLRYPLSGEPELLRIGDVTGDGLSDVVMLTAAFNVNEGRPDVRSVFLLVQMPDGTLAAPKKWQHPETRGFGGLLLIDFNRDGRRDIVVSTADELLIFDGNPAGPFVPRRISVDGIPGQLHDVDVNLDGIIDLVGFGYNLQTKRNGLWTYLGDGAGGITQRSFKAALVESNMAGKGDFNSDGLTDLVAVGTQGIEVWLRDPQGGFQPGYTIPPPLRAYTYGALSVGDFNHDGRDDLAFANDDNDPAWLYVYTQDRNGKLEGPRAYYTYDLTQTAAAGDINGDGLDDIVVVHTGWDAIGLYQQTTGGLAPEVKYGLPPYTSLHHVDGADIGDLDSDGCKDFAVADYNWGLVLYYGQNCIRPASAASDLDADGKADMVWRDRAGNAYAWKQGQKTSPQPIAATPGWTVLARGDFDGDGQGDLFWRNCVNGANRFSSAGSGSIRRASSITDRAWQLVGSGDLDGDGATDLVWRRGSSTLAVVWPGGDGKRERRLAGVPGPQWDLADIGDYDGDGKADMFWRQRQTGATRVWRGGDVTKARAEVRVLDINWLPVGSGDIDGDRRADLVWRHAKTGANFVWKSADHARREALDTVADPNWKIAAIDDYDGDRRADLFWHNTASGVNVMWKAAQSETRIMSASALGHFAAVTGAQSCQLPMPAANPLRRTLVRDPAQFRTNN